MKSLPYIGLGAYLLADMFLIVPSGLPQPADLMMMLTIALSFLACWQTIPNAKSLYISLFLWCIWAVVVSLIWFTIIADRWFVMQIFFYCFNAAIVMLVVAAGYHDWPKLRTVVRAACTAALLIEVVFLIANPPTPGVDVDMMLRSVGTFNNPNQMGYWALLMMACIALVKERRPLEFIDIAAFAAGSYAVMLSLSKAASISAMLMILAVMVSCRMSRPVIVAAIAAAALIVPYVLLSNHATASNADESTAISRLTDRLSQIGQQKDDDIMSRGYIRIVNHPQYLIFGAGEGAYERFLADNDGREFHSTIGNVLFSYGLIGLALFCLFLCVVFYRAPWVSWAYFAPLMLYGVTHMGLRTSELWVFLALVYAQSRWGEVRA